MTPEEVRSLQLGDRLRDVSDEAGYFRRTLWKVVHRDAAILRIWAPTSMDTRTIPLTAVEELAKYKIIWEEGPRPGSPKSVWDRLLEDE